MALRRMPKEKKMQNLDELMCIICDASRPIRSRYAAMRLWERAQGVRAMAMDAELMRDPQCLEREVECFIASE